MRVSGCIADSGAFLRVLRSKGYWSGGRAGAKPSSNIDERRFDNVVGDEGRNHREHKEQ
jgi:hypothetical protein